MLVEDILDGGITDFDPFKSQAVAQLVASPSRMFQAKSQDPLHLLGRCGEGIRFGNRRKILQSFDPVCLKPALVLVKLGAGNSALAASLTNIAQTLGQLQDTQFLMCDS